MNKKILQVFYGADALPYKDKERTVHFPIVGNAIQNANNTTQIKFYFDRLVEENEQTTFVAVSKLPNGKIGSKILETYDDEELGEQYALLDLDSFYTQYKGDVFISLQGYQGGVRVEQDEQGIYQIYGTPVIAATGSIKLAINYAPSFVGSGETENVTLQQVLGELSTKLGVRQETLHVEELPAVGNPDIWYVVNDDEDDPNKANIYIWNATTQSYVWVGDNTLDLGDYYTKEQGNQFEEGIDNRVTSVESELSSVAQGSPKGVYATLSDLESAYPTGTSGIYLVSADGHWYYWNGSSWTDGGVYLSTVNAASQEDLENLQSKVEVMLNDDGNIPFKVVDRTSIGSGNGIQYDSPNNKSTDYVDVSYLDKIIYARFASTGSTMSSGMAFYNENKQYISGQNGLLNQDTAHYFEQSIDVPANAKYARFTIVVYQDLGVDDFYIKGNINRNLKNIANKIETLSVFNLSATESSVSFSAIQVKKLCNSNVTTYYANQGHTVKTFTFQVDYNQYLLLHKDGTFEVVIGNDNVSADDYILLRMYQNKFNGGSLMPFLNQYLSQKLSVNVYNDLQDGDTVLYPSLPFEKALIGKGNNYQLARFHLPKNKSFRIYIFNKDYPTTSIPAGVKFSIRTITNGSLDKPFVSKNVEETISDYYDFKMPSTTDYLQIYVKADVGERVGFYISEHSAEISTEKALQTNMALMNKNAKQLGCKKTFFAQPYGSSILTPREAVKLALACLSDNYIATAWSKKEYNMAILGDNARAITIKSGYKNPEQYSGVSALSDYQIIGGKTGARQTPSLVRLNLVIAAKSKVDDAILIGAIMYAQSDTEQSNMFTMMRDMFDALELKRQGETVDISSLNCQGAYAIVCPPTALSSNYANDFNFLDISKNPDARINSHSLAKIGTALLVSKYLKQFNKLKFESGDLYEGVSGTSFEIGDIASVDDLMTTLFLTSSSEATIKLAHQIGIEYCKNDDAIASLCIDGVVAYISSNNGQAKFYDWIQTVDAEEWMLDSGKTISCSSSSSPVLVDNEPLYLGETAILGSSTISANETYEV